MINPALISAGINFASNLLSASAQSDEALMQSKMYENQAAIYTTNAKNLRLIGSLNENFARASNRALLAKTRGSLGEAGMGESPTTSAVMATEASALEQKVLNERYKVESEAENYLYQARIALENAKQAKKKSRNKFQSGMLSSVGGMFSSAMF